VMARATGGPGRGNCAPDLALVAWRLNGGPCLQARRMPGEPGKFRALAQVRACLGDDCKTVDVCLPWFESRTCHVKAQVRPGVGAGANMCSGAVRNTSPFTFRLKVVQVTALSSPIRDRMTGRRGEYTEKFKPSAAGRAAGGGPHEAPWEGRWPRRAAGQCPSGSRAAVSSLPPKPAKRHNGR
jgi:hypothetical protein